MGLHADVSMNTTPQPEEDQRTERRNLINDHIGKRIRLQRSNLGLSAVSLGSALNVRYQQIHFYERGDNQVTSSALYYLSQILNVPISFFFDGISKLDIKDIAFSQESTSNASDTINVFSVKDIKEVEQEVRSLAESFYKIEDREVRRGIIDFLKILGRKS